MEKIYNRYEDEHVACTIVYSNPDYKLYFDKECKETITAEQLKNLFIKGVVLEDSTRATLLKPVMFMMGSLSFYDGIECKNYMASAE